MKRAFYDGMPQSQRDKLTGKIYRMCQKLEKKIDQEYEAEKVEKAQTAIKIESDSENEQETVITTTTNKALLTSLKMTCSDSEDSCGANADCAYVSQTLSLFGLQNESSSKAFTAATVMRMFSIVLERVKKVQATSDGLRKEIEQLSERLARVEKKVCVSIATLETVKDGMVMHDEVSEDEDSNSRSPKFVFKKVTNEEEFTEFDSKLGNDAEFYSNVKKWLTKQIKETDPDNRMYAAMDLVMERTFFALCSWTGVGNPTPQIAFGQRTNVLKLFADIGSNKLVVLNDSTVEKFFRSKLRNKKRRLTLKGTRKTVCRKKICNSAFSV